MNLEGYIEKIIYRNEETGYTVFSVETTEGSDIMVGNLYSVYEGMYIQAEGEYVNHPQYDLQFSVSSYEVTLPADLDGIERFLGSGLIKGVRKMLAKRIVRTFKEDSLRILAEEPERLAEVKGISLAQAQKIAASYQENHEYENAVLSLSRYGIQANLALKIYRIYGKDAESIIMNNPYRLAEDVPGVGFQKADEIAARAGIARDSDFRMQSALLFVLSRAQSEGHIYLPEESLKAGCYEIMQTGENWENFSDRVHDRLIEMSRERKVVLASVTPSDEPSYTAVYRYWNYREEADSAERLLSLQLNQDIPQEEMEDAVSTVERELRITLDPVQKEAVRSAVCSGVAVITGGPGTGKTTIINAIIRYFEHTDMEVLLAAPTGRAAKRITESTGVEARTIHRLLEFCGEPSGENERKGFFARNEENPLECDAVIIDEMSMVDSMLMHSLLLALTPGTRLILVGDTDQLPSVGAGNVLHDIIASGCFPVTRLSTVFRQSEESQIVENAHRIRNGESLTITNKNHDFFFMPRSGTEAIIEAIIELVTRRLPGYLGVSQDEIQVLTPRRKNDLGAEHLNERLQRILNPESGTKREKKSGAITFREGDKVMQIRNDYKLEWQIPPSAVSPVKEEGVGVFNGDLGHVILVNSFDEEVVVQFDDGREVKYAFSQLDELEHAFAITIHKSQGSEYPAVVIPLFDASEKLLTRNLFYTAVTRAKSMVVLVGDLSMVDRMIRNRNEQKRYTSLELRLEEMDALNRAMQR